MSIFMCFKLFSEKQTNHVLKCLQTNSAKEFLTITLYLTANELITT